MYIHIYVYIMHMPGAYSPQPRSCCAPAARRAPGAQAPEAPELEALETHASGEIQQGTHGQREIGKEIPGDTWKNLPEFPKNWKNQRINGLEGPKKVQQC